MTTMRQLIIDAFRESGVIAVGATPEADEHAEALRRLQNIIKSLFGRELGENLKTANYDTISTRDTFPVNLRVIFDIDNETTVTLSPNPRDGARLAIIDQGANFTTNNLILDGNGRKIELTDTVTLATDSINREWFYRADLGNWARVTDLVAADESPFPDEFDDFLITLLAFRLNPRYGAETHQSTVDILSRMRSQFRARYRQENEMPSEDALIRLPSNHLYWYFEPTDTFDRGY